MHVIYFFWMGLKVAIFVSITPMHDRQSCYAITNQVLMREKSLLNSQVLEAFDAFKKN